MGLVQKFPRFHKRHVYLPDCRYLRQLCIPVDLSGRDPPDALSSQAETIKGTKVIRVRKSIDMAVTYPESFDTFMFGENSGETMIKSYPRI